MTDGYNRVAARVAANGAARATAIAAWDLVREWAAEMAPEVAEVYYKQLQEFLREELGPDALTPPGLVRPLTGAERRQFELDKLRFGKYAGHTVQQVLQADANYLLWLADEPFGKLFRRWLATPGVVKQLNDLAEEQADGR